MTVVSKIAGGAGILASLSDIHKTAVIESRKAYNKAASSSIISTSLGAQKADYVSFRDADRKNWINQNNFFAGSKEILARITGYTKGFLRTSARYLPNFALGAVALGAKNKTLAAVSTVALGVLEAWNFIKNATGIFQRTDYLE